MIHITLELFTNTALNPTFVTEKNGIRECCEYEH